MFEDEEPRSAVTHVFDLALALLIIINVSSVILESVESIRRHLASTFDLVENASTVFFAVEYVLRVWACVSTSSRCCPPCSASSAPQICA
jgi:voltage-gated potassium channel